MPSLTAPRAHVTVILQVLALDLRSQMTVKLTIIPGLPFNDLQLCIESKNCEDNDEWQTYAGSNIYCICS